MSIHRRIAAAARLLQSWYFACWLCVRIPEVSQWARSDHVGNHEYRAIQFSGPAPVLLLSLALTLGLLGNILQPLTWPNTPVQLHKTVGMSPERHNITPGVNKDQHLSVWGKTRMCCINHGKSQLFSSLGRAELRSFSLWALQLTLLIALFCAKSYKTQPRLTAVWGKLCT